MDEQPALRQQLHIAQTLLAMLEQQVAGVVTGPLPLPVNSQIVYKRAEIISLRSRLAQLEGGAIPVPDNLPQRVPGFIGRGEEISRCLTALDAEERGWGVVISGLGGIGKTTLALEVAYLARQRAWFDAYGFASAKTTWLTADGVRHETLALSSLDAFIQAFARLLGYDHIGRLPSATARQHAMLDALRGRRLLLIWDNLETLSDAERHLISVFLAKLPAPNKAIVTSRHRTTDRALTVQLDRLSFADMLHLMAELSRRQPRLAAVLARTGEDTCRALHEATGGNPLALQWTLGLVAQKNVSLPTALQRLRQAERSPDLYAFLFATAAANLAANDQTVLSALAAFQMPVTVATLAEATGLSQVEVGRALERLLTLALVNAPAPQQYGLHALTRTYVHTALQHGSAAASVMESVTLDTAAYRRGLHYWRHYAQRYGRENYPTFQHLIEAWPNLEATATRLHDRVQAMQSALDQEAARLLVDLSSALSAFCVFRGYWEEGIRLHTWAYEAAQSLRAWREAGWRAYDVARLHYQRAETDRAAIWAHRMTETMVRHGNQRDRAVAMGLRGLLALQRGNVDEAERCCHEALATAVTLGEANDQAVLLNDLGGIARSRHDFDRAEDYFRQGLVLVEKLGDKRTQAAMCGNLGTLALDRARYDEARTWYQCQLMLAQELGRHDTVAIAQTGLARVLEHEGYADRALPLAEQALQIRTRLHDRALSETRQLVARLRRRVGPVLTPAPEGSVDQ